MTNKSALGAVMDTCEVDEGRAEIQLVSTPDKRWLVVRRVKLNHIVTVVGSADIPEGSIGGRLRNTLLTEDVARRVMLRLKAGVPYADCFVFDNGRRPVSMDHRDGEHGVTSTGLKLWRHSEQLEAYRDGEPGSVISAHIAPEGACNLKCPYCSVTYRATSKRLDLDVVKRYVTDLRSRGLRAVILTGGGEPLAYRHISDLVFWLASKGLKLGLITNGTLSRNLDCDLWRFFSWVRVSTNFFPGWERKISIPAENLSDECVVGMSLAYTGEHEIAATKPFAMGVPVLRNVATIADSIGAGYVRVVPNCLLSEAPMLAMHDAIDRDLGELGDDRFFRQNKHHGAPTAEVCHMAYFRPYLSEQAWEDGEAGSVFPCDSVVENDAAQHFDARFAICKPQDILSFLDRKIEMGFNPSESCTGCVFTRNVDLLDRWVQGTEDRRSEFSGPIQHEEFV